MAALLQELLAKRKNRAIAIILSCKEKECDPYLPDEASERLRKVVLDVMNDFSDFCNDILRSMETSDWSSGVVLNEHFVNKLDEIHSMIRDNYA